MEFAKREFGKSGSALRGQNRARTLFRGTLVARPRIRRRPVRMHLHARLLVARHRPIALLVFRQLAKLHRAHLASAFAFTVAMKIQHACGAAPGVRAGSAAENHCGARSKQRRDGNRNAEAAISVAHERCWRGAAAQRMARGFLFSSTRVLVHAFVMYLKTGQLRRTVRLVLCGLNREKGLESVGLARRCDRSGSVSGFHPVAVLLFGTRIQAEISVNPDDDCKVHRSNNLPLFSVAP